MNRILIVRLGAFGDIVHALPALAALKRAFPGAAIDWLVDHRYAALLHLVPLLDRRLVVPRRTAGGWLEVVREVRRLRYDVALDLQGLLKSAALAKASGARRVIGFSGGHLREPVARLFYSGVQDPGPAGRHVIEKNLALLGTLGIGSVEWAFPIATPPTEVVVTLRRALEIAEDAPFALINPGAGWSNKRWPSDRFGALAAWVRERHGLPTAVVWGPGEEGLAREVADASQGAARVAPPTTIADLVALAHAASLMASGDSGPLHIAAAVGTPIVGLYGPTAAERNGPWSADDVVVSRHASCLCHHRRQCRADTWCLADITTEEVAAAVDRRLHVASAHA